MKKRLLIIRLVLSLLLVLFVPGTTVVKKEVNGILAARVETEIHI